MKKILNKKTSLFLMISIFSFGLFAENAKIKSVVNEKYYADLINKGLYTEYRDDGTSEFKLLPDSKYSDLVNASKVEKEAKHYPFTYESLYCLSKKSLLETSKSSASTITIDDVSRVCRSVSKMEGMMYYSTSHKKDMVLYEKCYLVDGENSDTKIPDQNTGNADGQISYCLQDDDSFGVNHYKLKYYQNEDQMLAQFNLTDVMGLGPFKAIYPGKMVINILVEDCGDDILLYLCTDIDSVKFPGIKGQITDSMTSRMDAIYKWFITQF